MALFTNPSKVKYALSVIYIDLNLDNPEIIVDRNVEHGTSLSGAIEVTDSYLKYNISRNVFTDHPEYSYSFDIIDDKVFMLCSDSNLEKSKSIFLEQAAIFLNESKASKMEYVAELEDTILEIRNSIDNINELQPKLNNFKNGTATL